MGILINQANYQDIDGILWGWAWQWKTPDNHAVLTYSFPTSSQVYLDQGYAEVRNFEAFNATQIAVGGKGHDSIVGNELKNTLSGGPGNDVLSALAGNDTLIGSSGRDKLSGGPGRDLFDFNSLSHSKPGSAHDTITDFKRGNNVTGDDIDLRTIDAKSGVKGNQAFKWIGRQDFHDKKGELHYKDLGSKCLVSGDVNGDGKADFEILIKIGSLSSGDFLL